MAHARQPQAQRRTQARGPDRIRRAPTGCSVRSASSPTTRLAARRGLRVLRWRTASRSAGTGTGTDDQLAPSAMRGTDRPKSLPADRSRDDRLSRLRLRQLRLRQPSGCRQGSQRSGHGGAELDVGSVDHRRADADEIRPRAQVVCDAADDRSKPSPHPVANRSTAHRPAHGVGNRRPSWTAGVTPRDRHRSRSRPRAPPSELVERVAFPDAPDPPHLRRLRRQTCATLATTSLHDGPSRLGGHPVAEAVVLRTAALVGLEGALHVGLPSATGQRSGPPVRRWIITKSTARRASDVGVDTQG